MRKILLCGALAAAALLPAGESRAYEGPWCAVANLGFGVIREDCSMPNFEVCREEAQSFGSTAFCRVNGAYPGYRSPGKERHRPLRHKKKRRHH